MPHQPSFQRQPTPRPLYIFDTHPIQYRTPVFQTLTQQLQPVRVFFFNEQFDGKKWWFHEFNKIPEQKFGVPLREGFSSRVLANPGGSPGSFLRQVRQILISEPPAAVVLYGYYLPEHWALWWLCQQLKIPLVFVGETFQSGGTGVRKFLKGLLRPIFFRGIFRFIAIGNRTQAFYRSQGIAEEKIISAKYCIDNSFFENTTAQRTDSRKKLRSQYGINDEDFVLLFVGRLFERKRPLDMVALQKSLGGQKRIHTWLVGNGPMENELKTAAAHEKNFHFLGFKNQTELREVYAAVDLLVVPSEYETWGLVVNEAAASGLPSVVTSECGVAQDLIINGETGFVVKVGDIEGLQKAVQALLQSPELHKKMGASAQQKVVREYSPNQFACALKKAYEAASRGLED